LFVLFCLGGWWFWLVWVGFVWVCLVWFGLIWFSFEGDADIMIM
jgi:hypothetical protein